MLDRKTDIFICFMGLFILVIGALLLAHVAIDTWLKVVMIVLGAYVAVMSGLDIWR